MKIKKQTVSLEDALKARPDFTSLRHKGNEGFKIEALVFKIIMKDLKLRGSGIQ